MARPHPPWVSEPLAQHLLAYVQVIYPILLLALYLIAFTVRSVVTASNDNDAGSQPQQLGPGGKPLPKKNNVKKEPVVPQRLDFSRPRKLLFEWLSVGVLATLAGNVAVIVVHVIWERDEQWWCGQAPVVCNRPRGQQAQSPAPWADRLTRFTSWVPSCSTLSSSSPSSTPARPRHPPIS